MTWIKTVKMSEANDRLLEMMAETRKLYPIEYKEPVEAAGDADDSSKGIMASHTLMPDAMYHIFSGFGAMMSPDLPLERRHHEMIATMVSVVNRCVY
ncbi:MAG TPA: hypothetical protein PLF26_05205 [Blastocatellia bacterium]|nr:hypothetical protein [Blastocatellia bacterium]